MFTYKFYVNARDGRLRLRLTNNRKKAELCLGQNMTQEELEKALSPDRKALPYSQRDLITRYEAKLADIQRELIIDKRVDEDVKVIRDMVAESFFARVQISRIQSEEEAARKAEEQKLFGRFYRRFAESKRNRGYRDSCSYTLKKLEEFSGADFDKLKFDDIDLRWLNRFDDWLIEHGAAQNSRNIHFKNIRTCINRAIDEELTDKYPFRRFKIRPEATRKRALPVEEIRRLATYPVEPHQEFYRDMFLLIFTLCGINTADLYGIDRIEAGRIEYRRAKTHRLYSIKVEPEAMALIEKYKGHNKLISAADRWTDYRDFNKNINVNLKRIGKVKRVGLGGKKVITPEWPELSTYWARHSWATIARKIGISKDDIALALGHSSGHPITDIYIDDDVEAIDRANRKVLDWVFHGKK